MKSIRAIIHDAGGVHAVAAASRRTKRPVTFDAVFKWYRNGIPSEHWQLVMKLSGASLQELFDANEAAAKRKLKPRRRDLAAAACQ